MRRAKAVNIRPSYTGWRKAQQPEQPTSAKNERAFEVEEDRDVERRANDPWRATVTARIDALEHRLAENTELTHAIKENTEQIVRFFEAGKGFFQVVRGVGNAARVVAYIAAAAGITWAVAKFGVAQILDDIGITKK